MNLKKCKYRLTFETDPVFSLLNIQRTVALVPLLVDATNKARFRANRSVTISTQDFASV